MPIGTNAKGGLLEKELDFGSESYREDIARSNLNLKPIIKRAGWDLLDAQFWFRTVQDEYREDDGIHWTAPAHRYLSNIFLTHIRSRVFILTEFCYFSKGQKMWFKICWYNEFYRTLK